MKRFLRSDTMRHLRLGKRRRKLQKWRRPRGHHNKIRLHRFGYPVAPRVGFGSPRKKIATIKGLQPLLVHNVEEVSKATKNMILIIARVGAKKKLDIIKKAQEMQLPIANLGGKK